MALKHDFIIVSVFLEPQVSEERFQKVEISDYLIQYIMDSLKWIRTRWNKKEDKDGINYYGESLIDSKNVMSLKKICDGWISVFQNATEELVIRGNYIYEEDEYEKITVKKEEVLNQLENLKNICDCALKNNMHILHKGI